MCLLSLFCDTNKIKFSRILIYTHFKNEYFCGPSHEFMRFYDPVRRKQSYTFFGLMNERTDKSNLQQRELTQQITISFFGESISTHSNICMFKIFSHHPSTIFSKTVLTLFLALILVWRRTITSWREASLCSLKNFYLIRSVIFINSDMLFVNYQVLSRNRHKGCCC